MFFLEIPYICCVKNNFFGGLFFMIDFIIQGTNARKIILEVCEFFILQCTVFGWKK